MSNFTSSVHRPGFTRLEFLVGLIVTAAALAILYTWQGSWKANADGRIALAKMNALGKSLLAYSKDSAGMLPYEDAPGDDDWVNAGKAENKDVWYNALPRQMGAKGVADLVDDGTMELFYDEDYPLFIPGAPYPEEAKKLSRPRFAIAMNSRLQRKNEAGVKLRGMLSDIEKPEKTVTFLESGLTNERRVMAGQAGFDGEPKANPRAFAARHNQKGYLLFADGHAEPRQAVELIEKSGRIVFPQSPVIWTADPEEDPN